MRQKALLLGLLIAALVAATSSPIYAQTTNAIDLSVSPPTTYFHIKPGSKLVHNVSLEHQGASPVTVTARIVDFTTDGQTGTPLLRNTSSFPHYSFTSSGRAPTTTFELQPGQKHTTTITFDVPETADHDEYPLTILFEAKPTAGTTIGVGNSDVTGIIGSNLIVLVSPTERDKGQVNVAKLDTPLVVDSLFPLRFQVTAENDGANATTASGSASITNWRGDEVAAFPIYPDMVLSGSSRILRTMPDLTTALEDPEVLSTNFEHQPAFLFGPYTVTVELEQNGSDEAASGASGSSTHSKIVVAFPFSLAGALIIGVALYVALKKRADYLHREPITY